MGGATKELVALREELEQLRTSQRAQSAELEELRGELEVQKALNARTAAVFMLGDLDECIGKRVRAFHASSGLPATGVAQSKCFAVRQEGGRDASR